MDADCLIKLAKAGVKECVCEAWLVSIPQTVRRETVEQAPELPDAVATDDTRFIRTLRGLGVAYAVPAVIIVQLREEGSFSTAEAIQALKALRPHISQEEHAAAQLMLSERRMP